MDDTNQQPTSPAATCLRPWTWKGNVLALCAVVIGFIIMHWSTPVYLFFNHWLHELPLASFFSTMTQFSAFWVLVIISFLIILLDKKQRVYVPYFVAALLLSGAVTSAIKQAAGRTRPEWSVSISKKHQAKLITYAREHPAMKIPTTDKDNWLGLSLARPFFKDRYSSFPSGHASRAFVIVAFLCVLYPRARIIWFICGVGCALSRVRSERHFVDDVVIASALAWILSQWVFSWHWPLALGRQLFERKTNEEPITAGNKEQDTFEYPDNH